MKRMHKMLAVGPLIERLGWETRLQDVAATADYRGA